MKPITKDAPVTDAVIITPQAASADLTTADGFVQLGAGTPVAVGGKEYTLKGDGIPANLIYGYVYEPFAAGTAQISEEDLSGIVLVVDHQYIAYADINGTLHSWGVIYTGTPPASEAIVVLALIAKINSSPNVGVTAAVGTGQGDLELTGTVAAGNFEQYSSEGGTVTIGTPYVAPVGDVAEVESALGSNVFGGSSFDCAKYTIVWTDFVNHNNISGQGAMRISSSVIYMRAGQLAAALAGTLDDLFDGSTTPWIGTIKKGL